MSCDNRQFLRVPAGEGFATAVVRLDGKKTLACEVVNKSSGGYGIAVPLQYETAFPPGRILVVDVDELILQVRVAHADQDPEEDRYLIGLECIAELEDKTRAGQPQVSWLSALRPTSAQGVGGGPAGLPRDVVLAIFLCCGLLAFTVLPSLFDQRRTSRPTSRSTWSQLSFSLPWEWPSRPRPGGPQSVVGVPKAPAVTRPVSGPTTPAANSSSPLRAGPPVANK